MHDLKDIRENPSLYDTDWNRRGEGADNTKTILDLDEQRRAFQTSLQEKLAERNTLSKEIGAAMKRGESGDLERGKVNDIKEDIAELEVQEKELAEKLNHILDRLPNRLHPDVPDGTDEDDNIELRRWGDDKIKRDGKDHVDIGEVLGLMDYEAAANMSGARFVILKGDLARLERALGHFMLDLHTSEHGYTEISPPLMTREHAMYGTAQLPKFEEDQFRTTRGDYLIPTAEVVLTNLFREQILNAQDLPYRVTAFTPNFRQEAGSAGRDTRGMIRQHQFWKVELVSIVHQDKTEEEFDRMVNCAETVLKKLDLPFRSMVLCAGDLGFASRKTIDLEVWLPGQNTYREISSCSQFHDLQARRMNTRAKDAETGKNQFVHTLNGSGVAVGRCLVAVLENYYDPESRSVVIPDVLRPYMRNKERIEVATRP